MGNCQQGINFKSTERTACLTVLAFLANLREYQQLHHIGAWNKTHFDKIKSTILILQKKKLNKRNTCMHTKF